MSARPRRRCVECGARHWSSHPSGLCGPCRADAGITTPGVSFDRAYHGGWTRRGLIYVPDQPRDAGRAS